MNAKRAVFPIFTLAVAVLSGPANAQDQLEILDYPAKLLASGAPANPNQLTIREARALIDATLQQRDTPNPKYIDDPNFYCIINLLKWNEDAMSQKDLKKDSSKWFVFRGGNKGTQAVLEGDRIYGSARVAVLYVHWTQAVKDPTEQTLQDYLRANPDAVHSRTGETQDAAITRTASGLMADFLAGKLDAFSDARKRNLVRLAGATFVANYPPQVAITYRIEVTKKIPAPVLHLLQLAAAGAQGGGALPLTNQTVAVWAGDVYTIQYLPCDIVVKAQMPDLSVIDSKKFDDEGNYRFDFSAGIPIRGIKQLEYDTTSGSATPKVVTKTNVYGLVNYFWHPVDVKTDYQVWPPSLLAGVALTGRPFDRPMAGLGFGYGKLSGFIGCAFNKVHTPAAAGGTTQDSHFERKLVFGVNITAKAVAALLNSKNPKTTTPPPASKPAAGSQ